MAEKVGQLEQARVYIEEIDGLTKIEKLQENENEEVYKLAYHMVEKFFSDDVIICFLVYDCICFFLLKVYIFRMLTRKDCSPRSPMINTISFPLRSPLPQVARTLKRPNFRSKNASSNLFFCKKYLYFIFLKILFSSSNNLWTTTTRRQICFKL